MGTEVTVQLWHDDQAQADKLIDEVMHEMRRVDALMSTFTTIECNRNRRLNKPKRRYKR